ncbi:MULTISPECIES: hypothetical protein [Enterococcus]|uniref:Uncharacterized protein n=1 Tax=Enterococcus malodoratus ATCC 43197 TaxID=1158601 RepID=R2R925_9ENTE|nr:MULTISPECIES: hypothetical protein [Enterococcus]BBM19659.1 hypothetical protein G15_3339 [Enterococcus avium]EOH72449.1 hypothetical protein UAI_04034 [Enterococcus malodoratus ATCC 43197]EOT70225.1 hypothetical protein I585_01704 [Enterococcus malodoratus ATCC 43197]MDN6518650.1 hypothetical protein [Enterococcus sp.]SET84711.1 hypothetical protein SAMN04487821_1252 [Enterococcus malodoratus]
MVTYQNLQTDLLQALDLHIDILKEVDDIETEELPGFLFMMRSLGFMLDRAALVLASNNDEEMYYMMFQYYSLLKELKFNLAMNFPHTQIQGDPLIDMVNHFPNNYEKEMKAWWEEKTGLTVEETKQTIELND